MDHNQAPAPGWYTDPDPESDGLTQRYWTGNAWTDHIRRLAPPQAPSDPQSPAAASAPPSGQEPSPDPTHRAPSAQQAQPAAGQQTAPHEIASRLERVGSHVLDVLVLLAAGVVLTFAAELLLGVNPDTLTGTAEALFGWTILALATAYWTVFHANGRKTVGKRATGTVVVDAETGSPVSVGRALGRAVGLLLSVLPFGLGLLWAFIDPQRQTWHDHMAGTVVVRELQ